MTSVLSRGDRREDIFRGGVDRQDFIKTLAEVCQKTGWQVPAYSSIWSRRILRSVCLRPDFIQHAQQFHFRPFNGHHAQVPITDAQGRLTQEVVDWLPFAEALLSCWLDGNRNTNREILICPELGPVAGGYALSTFPNSWEDAKVLRGEIEKLWRKAF